MRFHNHVGRCGTFLKIVTHTISVQTYFSTACIAKRSLTLNEPIRMFFVQTSTRPPNMHLKLTKHGRFCKQNNQLPTESYDELKDNSTRLKSCQKETVAEIGYGSFDQHDLQLLNNCIFIIILV